MLSYVKIILALWIVCLGSHFVQANDSTRISQKDTSQLIIPNFFEYSRLFNISKKYPYQKDLNLLFEANVGYNFMLYGHQSKKKPRKHFNLSMNPRFMIRMLSDDKLTVVPVSYMFNIQAAFLGYQRDAALGSKSLFISLNHHSNGQRGDLIGEESLNIINGQFSTNYLKIFHTWSFLQNNHQNNFLLGLESHFTENTLNANIPGSLSEFVGDSYGTQRFLLGYMHSVNLDLGQFKNLDLRFKMNYEYILKEPENKKYYNLFNRENEIPRHDLSLELMLFPNWNSDLGFFTRLHSGQDYYNLYFFNNLTQLQFGIIIDQMNLKKSPLN